MSQNGITIPLALERTRNMELKDFVEQALTQITEGVVAAQGNLEPFGAKVNPKMSHMFSGEKKHAAVGWAQGEGSNPILMVSFDVAVTTTEGTKTQGGIGVVTGILSLGSTGATDKGNSAATRIAFEVPLLLPAHPGLPQGAA
jgi:hypothetical protein